MIARWSPVVAVVVVNVVGASGCDLFGIRCNADEDCPADAEFCNLGICSATDGPVRAEGEGEGNEGEGGGGCDSDADCADDRKGICYDLAEGAQHFEADRVGTCVPGAADDVSCPEVDLLGGSGADRPSGGQALFEVTAVRVGGDCGAGSQNLSMSALYVDREGDFSGSGSMIVMPEGASSPFYASASPSGDGTSGQLFFEVRDCVSDSATHIAVAIGNTNGPESNVVCVALAAP